jgi:DNA-binding CsgD family transcriptional regulator
MIILTNTGLPLEQARRLVLWIFEVHSTMVSTAAPSFVVVDLRCRIRYASAGGQGDSDLKRIIINRVRLQPDVEAFVRGLASVDRNEVPSPVRFRFLDDDRILRVVRVTGDEGTMFILSIEEDRNRSSLVRAARRHELTRRETEVLALILDGSSAGEIAEALAISEHTVQGYFKRLLYKTGARNRVSMVAGILDWDSAMRVAPSLERSRVPAEVTTAV